MEIEINKLIEDENYCRNIFNFFIKKGIIKKTNPELFMKHLNKSISNLEFGNFILSEHKFSIKRKLKNKSFFDWCVIIYYYSLYHSILALISKAGFESKSHIASICSLILFYYHRENILKKEDIQFIIDNLNLKSEDIEFMFTSKGIREKASYRVDETFDLILAKNSQEKTVELVNRIKNILKE